MKTFEQVIEELLDAQVMISVDALENDYIYDDDMDGLDTWNEIENNERLLKNLFVAKDMYNSVAVLKFTKEKIEDLPKETKKYIMKVLNDFQVFELKEEFSIDKDDYQIIAQNVHKIEVRD